MTSDKDLYDINFELNKWLNIFFLLLILVFNVGFLVRLLMRRSEQPSIQKLAILISITSVDIFLAVFPLPVYAYSYFISIGEQSCSYGIVSFVAVVTLRCYIPCVYVFGLMMLSAEIFLRHRLQSGTRMVNIMASVIAASVPHILSFLLLVIITVSGVDYDSCLYLKTKFYIALTFLTNIIPMILALVVVILLTCIPPLKATQPSPVSAGGYHSGVGAYPGSAHDRPPSVIGVGDAPLQNPLMAGDHHSDLLPPPLPPPPPPPPPHTESVKGTWDSEFGAQHEPNMSDSSSAMKDLQWPQPTGQWPPPNEPSYYQGQTPAGYMYNPSSSPDAADDSQSAANVKAEKRAVLIVTLVTFFSVMLIGVWSLVTAYGHQVSISYLTYFVMHVISFSALLLRSVLAPILWRFL